MFGSSLTLASYQVVALRTADLNDSLLKMMRRNGPIINSTKRKNTHSCLYDL